MKVAVLVLFEDCLHVGFCRDPEPQCVVPLDSFSMLALQDALLKAIDSLLMAPSEISVIVVEPPLFSLIYKQRIAEALLLHLRVHSVGFLQRSVSLIAGLCETPEDVELGAGMIVDLSEHLAVPVYDFRELTPFTRTTTEFPNSRVVELIISALPIDLRQPVQRNVVIVDNDQQTHKGTVWRGASALGGARKVWPLINRENFQQGLRVWDSLYDMK